MGVGAVERLSVGESWAEVGPPEEGQFPLPLPYRHDYARQHQLTQHLMLEIFSH
jgi:hypothetical protein